MVNNISASEKSMEYCNLSKGVQYTAYAYTGMLSSHQVQIGMADVGKAEENCYAERFNPTIKEEEVDMLDYTDFFDARNQIGLFIDDVYMTKHIHSSLGYLTPVEFETAWRLTNYQPIIASP